MCSDEARNGKTLFARILGDQVALSDISRLCVFDTDHPRGDLVHWFPKNTQIIDLSRTVDQIKLFDTMIGEPDKHYVVDLQSSLLEKFFKIFHDIAFDEAVSEAGTAVTVYFIVDRSYGSVLGARSVHRQIRASEFVTVINEAIGSPLQLAEAALAYRGIPKDREIVLPALSRAAREYINSAGFTFSDFIVSNAEAAPANVRFELWAFLERIYNQRTGGGSARYSAGQS
ncbi:MAG: hypothetical protein KDJ90_07130 [Nitratireductor sp.]|nr:hypothetical protein [Nitratireductor sp.]